ncbi:MAG TPA: DUF1800 family protein [Flavipsychrobacter sp.]|nr:DUF1800 family protein [Flavipsychrobacter sp.]
MSDKKYRRRDFLQKVANREEEEILTTENDPLFQKFARKNLSEKRVYSPEAEKDEHTAARIGNVTTGLNPYAGTWSEREVLHLLRRTGFGATPAQVASYLAMGVSNAVDTLCIFPSTPSAPSATPLNHYQGAYVDPNIALGNSWTSDNLSYGSLNTSLHQSINSQRQNSLIYWTWGVWLNDAGGIREKMVQFWYHFIPVDFDDVRSLVSNSATMCNDYMSYFRNNALGNFKTIIKDIAKQPAMLYYLGNHYSTATAPNENFARELLELFTMGKDPVQNYTEPDIQEAAKVFSGWRLSSSINPYPFVVAFNSTFHNTSNKTFSSNFGPTTITGLSGASGATEFDAFFNMLFNYQAVTISKYICRRLYRYFVYYDIDVNVETNVIVPLAAALVTNNWNMAPIVKMLLKSDHFYDMANRGVMIKSPFDLVAGTLRTFNVNTTPATGTSQLTNQYTIWSNLNSQTKNNMEQAMGLVPNVSGWKAYYQDPTYYQNWINSNTIQKRSGYMTSLLNGYTTGSTSIKIDPIAFVQQFPNTTLQNPDLLVDMVVLYLLPVDLTPTYKDTLKTQNLLNNQTNNNYWTVAWNDYANNPTNTSYKNTVTTRLKALLSAILQLAEYQLM